MRPPKDPRLPPSSVEDVYLIWSAEHCGWWRPNRYGYTERIEEAGRYSKADALHIYRGTELGNECIIPLGMAVTVLPAYPTDDEILDDKHWNPQR